MIGFNKTRDTLKYLRLHAHFPLRTTAYQSPSNFGLIQNHDSEPRIGITGTPTAGTSIQTGPIGIVDRTPAMSSQQDGGGEGSDQPHVANRAF